MLVSARIALLSIVALSFCGCNIFEGKYQKAVDDLKSELVELKTSLGEYQYLAIDPQISFTIKDVEFSSGDNLYGSPSVKFKASIKQNNTAFPLKKYSISINLAILDQANNEVDDCSVSSEIENGVLALAEEQTLYGLKISKGGGRLAPPRPTFN